MNIVDIFSFGAILSSVLVITSKNPVVAVIFLISLFLNTAGYLILLGISFVGISYIIIYIGAITVLFLFVILMINIRLLDILEIGGEYTKNIPLAFLVGSLFVYEILSIIPFSINDVSVLNLPLDLLSNINGFILNYNISSTSLPIFSITAALEVYGVWPTHNYLDFIISEYTQISVLGQGLYSYGALWLLLSSMILLLSMLSAIVLSTPNTKKSFSYLTRSI